VPAVFQEQELIAAMLQVVCDAQAHLVRGEPEPWLRACSDAWNRDPQVGNLARGLARQLVDGTGGETEAERLELARAVLESPAPGDPLAEATFDLVRSASGEDVDWDDVWKRGKKLRRLNRRPRPKLAPEPATIAVADAESTLRALLGAAELEGALPDPHAVWNVFKAFAAFPVGPVRHDACLFQWGTHGARFVWDLTRQLTLDDEYGDYDHMEQLHCTCSFEPDPGLEALGSGEVWSGDELSAWVREVETLEAFARVAGSRPAEVRVGQERV
jgi:hypothetical protein